MIKTIATAAAFTLALAMPTSADPSVGFGLSFSFGAGNVDYGVGVRVFSNNEQDELAASVGIDYMFQSKRIRPTFGVAYLGDKSYISIDLGFGINGEGIDLGVNLGSVNTSNTKTKISPEAPEVIVSPENQCGAGQGATDQGNCF